MRTASVLLFSAHNVKTKTPLIWSYARSGYLTSVHFVSCFYTRAKVIVQLASVRQSNEDILDIRTHVSLFSYKFYNITST